MTVRGRCSGAAHAVAGHVWTRLVSLSEAAACTDARSPLPPALNLPQGHAEPQASFRRRRQRRMRFARSLRAWYRMSICARVVARLRPCCVAWRSTLARSPRSLPAPAPLAARGVRCSVHGRAKRSTLTPRPAP